MNSDQKVKKNIMNKTKNYWFSLIFILIFFKLKIIFVPPEIRILNGLYGPAPMLPAYFSFSFWKKIQSKKSLQLRRKWATWVNIFCLLICIVMGVTRENKFGVIHKRCRFNWWGGPISSATVVRLQQYLLESRVSIL